MDRNIETADLAFIDLGAVSVETQGGPGFIPEQGQALGEEGISEA